MFEKLFGKQAETIHPPVVERYTPRDGERKEWWQNNNRYQIDPGDNRQVEFKDIDNKTPWVNFMTVSDREQNVFYTGSFMKLEDENKWIPLRRECYRIKASGPEARGQARETVREIYNRVSEYTKPFNK